MEREIRKHQTRPVFLGGVQVGGGAPVVVQSMTCTDTRDVPATVDQITALEEAGCEVVRVAVPDMEAAVALEAIRKRIRLPLIADIHFNYRLALEAMKSGVDGIRINPGNIGAEKVRIIVKEAKSRNVVIRIGINAGSLEKALRKKYGGPSADALVESALRSIDLFEEMDFSNIKLSLKSSDVTTMVEAYRGIAEKTDYPLHLGVTEAGSPVRAAIKSGIGIGMLLYEGIGDTIRVSVTGSPVLEVGMAYTILRSLNLRRVGPDIISCPTCGRCEIDLFRLSEEVETKMTGLKSDLRIALMGCVVNGPGEAAEADIGIAGGRGSGVLFKKGRAVRKVKESEFVPVLIEEIHKMTSGN